MCSLKMLGPNFNDMLVSIIKISKVIMETEIREIVLTLDITAESTTINKIKIKTTIEENWIMITISGHAQENGKIKPVRITTEINRPHDQANKQMKSSKKDSIPEKIQQSQIIGKYQYLLNRYQMMMIRCLEALRKRQPKI